MLRTAAFCAVLMICTLPLAQAQGPVYADPEKTDADFPIHKDVDGNPVRYRNIWAVPLSPSK